MWPRGFLYVLSSFAAGLQLIGKQSYVQNNAALLGVVLNKVNPKEHSIISQQVKSKVQSDDFAFAGALPFNPLLTSVRWAWCLCMAFLPTAQISGKKTLGF